MAHSSYSRNTFLRLLVVLVSGSSVTNDHNVRVYKQQGCIFHSSGGQKFNIRFPGPLSAGQHSLQRLKGRIHSSSLSVSVATLTPWFVVTSQHSLPPFLHHIFLLCLYNLPLPLSYKAACAWMWNQIIQAKFPRSRLLI